jgi:hypothetical protein
MNWKISDLGSDFDFGGIPELGNFLTARPGLFEWELHPGRRVGAVTVVGISWA